ncbi:MAG: hypothetical protein ACI4E1_02475 [Lachnospira sp.]
MKNKIKWMRTLLIIVRAEICRFINATYKLYAAFVLAGILQMALFFTFIMKLIEKGQVEFISLGDTFFYLFRGVNVFSKNDKFEIPVFEIFLFLYLLIIICNYTKTDLKSVGQKIVVASGGATNWWVSKMVTVVFMVLTHMVTYVLLAVLLGKVIIGDHLTLVWKLSSSDILSRIVGFVELEREVDMVRIVLLIVITVITICTFSMLAALITNESIAVIITFTYMIISVRYAYAWLVFNNCMLLRVNIFYDKIWQLVLCLIFTNIICAAGGIIYLRKSDYL